jgi:hypothetical protein
MLDSDDNDDDIGNGDVMMMLVTVMVTDNHDDDDDFLNSNCYSSSCLDCCYISLEDVTFIIFMKLKCTRFFFPQ